MTPFRNPERRFLMLKSVRSAEPAPVEPLRQPLLRRQRRRRLLAHRRPGLHACTARLQREVVRIARRRPEIELRRVELDMELHRQVRPEREGLVRAGGARREPLRPERQVEGLEVPLEDHFYMGMQCFQCADPPCVKVCPVGATWQEPDGITVIDYDWCIGCRYCMAACPYWARRFNWAEPEVPADELNTNQHYLGNRARKMGVVEKCTFCIHRTRQGRLPACAEACPTGARVFGNLLDPGSEIRWVLANKRVFRLKEDLETHPRFWYFTD